MSSSRQVIEKHLKSAQETLQTRQQHLTEQKFDKKKSKRDVKFRQLQALVRKYSNQLKALDKVDAVLAEVAQRRAEKAAQPKAPKEKKKRAAPAPKAKASGGKKEKKA